jgi:hypothetical protein
MTWTTPRTWIAGEIVTAALMNAQIRDNVLSIVYAPIAVEDKTDLLALTNTSFAAGATNCGTTFTAPDSGKVFITVRGHIESNTTAETAYMGFEVRAGGTFGAGTSVQAGDTDYSVGSGATGVPRIAASNRHLITGLTPGSTYNTRTMHQTTGGNFDVFYRGLILEAVH